MRKVEHNTSIQLSLIKVTVDGSRLIFDYSYDQSSSLAIINYLICVKSR